MDKRAYLFLYSSNVGTREQVKAFLNTKPDVFLHWYCVLPYSFFIVSDKSPQQLGEIIRQFTKDERFILLDANTDRYGWLPMDVWEFITKPKAVWEDKPATKS